jgi:malate dehydrogenase (oxaloacetate-decarboxylating)
MYSRSAQARDRDGERVFETEARGLDVLRDPALNKGNAFSADERARLGLVGLLPTAVGVDLAEQVELAYAHYQARATDLDKHVFMWSVHDNNVTLFYALIQKHLLEILPVVYDPTVGEAIAKFSEVYTRPRGLFLSIDDPGGVEASLAAAGAGSDEIDLLVATDAEEILGIGDWGAGGIDISIGKLAVYTAAAGVDPHRVLPVVLDVGTDNETLLNDPYYAGNRHGRVRGQAYDDFVDAYAQAARKLFPSAVLHWEDFGSTNCRRILDRYRDTCATFNDDMQGTGAIAMSGLLNAVKLTGSAWSGQRVVVLGGGTAGCGIADQVRDQMVRDGLSPEQAIGQIFIVDLPGLLTDDMTDGLLDYQRPYAKPASSVADWEHTAPVVDTANASRWPAMAKLQAERAKRGIIDLGATVAAVHPTILIGTSTTPGRFTEAIINDMAAHAERPIVFPLSNPTPLAEATPAQILNWTNGQALVATGSPFDDVELNGVTHRIGQANNAALYPGLGLGVIVGRACRITDEMILAAALAVAGQADLTSPGAALLPSNADLRATSSVVAVDVIKVAQSQGVAGAAIDNPVEAVRRAAWWPEYRPVVAV